MNLDDLDGPFSTVITAVAVDQTEFPPEVPQEEDLDIDPSIRKQVQQMEATMDREKEDRTDASPNSMRCLSDNSQNIAGLQSKLNKAKFPSGSREAKNLEINMVDQPHTEDRKMTERERRSMMRELNSKKNKGSKKHKDSDPTSPPSVHRHTKTSVNTKEESPEGQLSSITESNDPYKKMTPKDQHSDLTTSTRTVYHRDGVDPQHVFDSADRLKERIGMHEARRQGDEVLAFAEAIKKQESDLATDYRQTELSAIASVDTEKERMEYERMQWAIKRGFNHINILNRPSVVVNGIMNIFGYGTPPAAPPDVPGLNMPTRQYFQIVLESINNPKYGIRSKEVEYSNLMVGVEPRRFTLNTVRELTSLVLNTDHLFAYRQTVIFRVVQTERVDYLQRRQKIDPLPQEEIHRIRTVAAVLSLIPEAIFMARNREIKKVEDPTAREWPTGPKCVAVLEELVTESYQKDVLTLILNQYLPAITQSSAETPGRLRGAGMIAADDAPDGRDAYQMDSIFHKMGYPVKYHGAEGRKPPSPDTKMRNYDPHDRAHPLEYPEIPPPKSHTHYTGRYIRVQDAVEDHYKAVWFYYRKPLTNGQLPPNTPTIQERPDHWINCYCEDKGWTTKYDPHVPLPYVTSKETAEYGKLKAQYEDAVNRL